MGYSEEDIIKIVDERRKRLSIEIEVCRKVCEMLDSAGWKEIAEPMIDRMITDVTGGKVGGRYVSGLLDRARKDERREYYIGYKQSLIDLHSRLTTHRQQLELKSKELEEMKKGLPAYRLPLNDSRYTTHEVLDA